MSGIVFYDAIDGSVPLKSSIPSFGVLNITNLNDNVVDVINKILDLDVEEYKTFVQDEDLMRLISTMFWYSPPKEKRWRRPTRFVEYSEFLRGIPWNTPSGTTAPGNVPLGSVTPIWFPSEEGFWVYPPEYITRGRSSLKSLIALWLSLEGSPPTGIEVIENGEDIKVFHDKRNKILYPIFKLHGNDDSVCFKIDTDNVFARAFEINHEDIVYYSAALRYSGPTSVNVSLLRYPEWDVELAYEALFEGSKVKPMSQVTVKLKIE